MNLESFTLTWGSLRLHVGKQATFVDVGMAKCSKVHKRIKIPIIYEGFNINTGVLYLELCY